MNKVHVIFGSTIAAVVIIASSVVIMSQSAEWDYPQIDSNVISESRPQSTTLDMVTLVDPNDRAVREIATHMETPDDVFAFIKKHISPARDIDVYGVSEYWASPAETLFHRSADCEDAAILTAAIFLAMELEPTILIITAKPVGHVAVLLNGQYYDIFATVHNKPPMDLSSVTGILGIKIGIDGNIVHRALDPQEIFS